MRIAAAVCLVLCMTSMASAAGLQLRSSTFLEGQMIPKRYTCDGADTSPPLSWTGVPLNTKTLALVVEDPDAPAHIWVHWVLYNMPPMLHGLAEGKVPAAAAQGTNDFGKRRYNGPCPPGGTHRYIFTLYALNCKLDLPATASGQDFEHAISSHVVEMARLTGKYQR